MKLFILSILVIFLTSCREKNSVSFIDNITIKNGSLIVKVTDTDTPLTSNKNIIWYQNKKRKIKIFTGNGNGNIKFTLLDNKTLVIEYCKGNIEQIESSFFRDLSQEYNDMSIIRVQLINNSNFRYNNLVFCKDGSRPSPTPPLAN